MLLWDPEYLTAVNARKRTIICWEKQSEDKGKKRIAEDLGMMK
jgi:hypothetical protein